MLFRRRLVVSGSATAPTLGYGRHHQLGVRHGLALQGLEVIGTHGRGGLLGFRPAPGLLGSLAALRKPLDGEGSLGHGELLSSGSCWATVTSGLSASGGARRESLSFKESPEQATAGVNKLQRPDKYRLIVIRPPRQKRLFTHFPKPF